jgi:hypothetical protein
MNLIVFGAGASYGSDTSNVPPLGNNLFDALVEFDPENWSRLPREIQELLRRDFEQGMQKLYIEHSTWLPPLQRSMARFFFNFVPKPNNLYVRIAKLIKQSCWNLEGALVTFNYERLLLIALECAGIQPIVLPLPSEIQCNSIELCLPHGICNLFISGIQARNITFSSGIIFDGGKPQCIVNPLEFQERITKDSIPPIMSYFVPEKINPSGYTFIIKNRERYKELVLKADKIAIIGLKVRPHDKHIWDPLSETDAPIIYCSGKWAGSEFLAWCKQKRVGKINKVLDGYFSDHFTEICQEIGIG